MAQFKKKHSELKIKEIKPSIKIISNSTSDANESLEDDVNDMETERFASFVSSGSFVPVLRSNAIDGEEAEGEEPSADVERPSGERRDAPLYTTRADSLYEVPGSSSADLTGEERMYEDPMVSASRRIGQQAKPTMLLHERHMPHASEPSLGIHEKRGGESLQDQGVRAYAPKEERDTREKKRRYAWEA